jgi:6-pyruvoyl-tetrahydropterin synthase
MVMDFKDLKKAMNAVLDPLDHCMVLAHDDPLWELSAYKSHPEGGCSDIHLAEALKATNGAEPRLIRWHENPTAESFAKWALERIQDELKRLWVAEVVEKHKELESYDIANHAMPYFISSVKVWETATSYAEAQSGEG